MARLQSAQSQLPEPDQNGLLPTETTLSIVGCGRLG